MEQGDEELLLPAAPLRHQCKVYNSTMGEMFLIPVQIRNHAAGVMDGVREEEHKNGLGWL